MTCCVEYAAFALSAYTHQDLPFEKLIDVLQPDRDLSRNPLFDVMFQLRNMPHQDAYSRRTKI